MAREAGAGRPMRPTPGPRAPRFRLRSLLLAFVGVAADPLDDGSPDPSGDGRSLSGDPIVRVVGGERDSAEEAPTLPSLILLQVAAVSPTPRPVATIAPKVIGETQSDSGLGVAARKIKLNRNVSFDQRVVPDAPTLVPSGRPKAGATPPHSHVCLAVPRRGHQNRGPTAGPSGPEGALDQPLHGLPDGDAAPRATGGQGARPRRARSRESLSAAWSTASS